MSMDPKAIARPRRRRLRGHPCPLEVKVANALDDAGITYSTPDERRAPTGLDFRIEDGSNVEIEIKWQHTERSIRQLSSADNVILLQGPKAVQFFVDLLTVRNIIQEQTA